MKNFYRYNNRYVVSVIVLACDLAISAVMNKSTENFSMIQTYDKHNHHIHHHKSVPVHESDKTEYEKMVHVDPDGHISFYWNTPSNDVDNKVLNAQVVYDGHAWLGFGVSSEGGMAGATAVIGKPTDHRVRKYVVVGSANEWIDEDELVLEEQTLQDTQIIQDDESTTLSFHKLLEEENEESIKVTGSNHFLFAVGENNTLRKPKKTYAVKLNLSRSIGTETPTTSPSKTPTKSPSKTPTKAPSNTPTRSKSPQGNSSTNVPTSSPSASPNKKSAGETSAPTVSSGSHTDSNKDDAPAKKNVTGPSQRTKIAIISGIWAGVLGVTVILLCCHYRVKNSDDSVASDYEESRLFLDERHEPIS